MCGRFENTSSIQTLIDELKKYNIDLQLDLELDSNLKHELEHKLINSVNIAPTNKIFSISYTSNDYRLSLTNWGIKFSEKSPLIFNSRIETIKEKKFWNMLFDKNRLLVPMSAFYEWKKEGTRKIPYRIFLPDEEIFFVPALYSTDKNKKISTSLITTTPNEFIKPIHHRMPVILKIKDGINYLLDNAERNLTRCIPYSGKMDLESVIL